MNSYATFHDLWISAYEKYCKIICSRLQYPSAHWVADCSGRRRFGLHGKAIAWIGPSFGFNGMPVTVIAAVPGCSQAGLQSWLSESKSAWASRRRPQRFSIPAPRQLSSSESQPELGVWLGFRGEVARMARSRCGLSFSFRYGSSCHVTNRSMSPQRLRGSIIPGQLESPFKYHRTTTPGGVAGDWSSQLAQREKSLSKGGCILHLPLLSVQFWSSCHYSLVSMSWSAKSESAAAQLAAAPAHLFLTDWF